MSTNALVAVGVVCVAAIVISYFVLIGTQGCVA